MNALKLFIAMILLVVFSACTENSAPKNDDFLTREEDDLLETDDPEFAADYRRELADAIEEEKINADYELVRELEDSEDAKRNGENVKGSCEAIADASTCIEYYGSFWTAEQIQFNCEGAGNFSTDPCPSDMSGGCNTGFGTEADMVVWMYLRGGGEMTEESMKYAQMACDATIASKWIQK